MDITYIPMVHGFVYLVAVVDWFSRRVLAWRLSITMDTSFCIDALDEALSQYGRPEIFNTDQGSQFTSEAFTGRLKDEGILIRMDGNGRWCDNLFVERFWRSLKYGHVYLHAHESMGEANSKIASYIEFYNSRRPLSSLGGTDAQPGILPPSARSSGGLTRRKNRPWKCRSYGKLGKLKYCFPPFPQDLEDRRSRFLHSHRHDD